jgi:hypothetical protein
LVLLEFFGLWAIWVVGTHSGEKFVVNQRLNFFEVNHGGAFYANVFTGVSEQEEQGLQDSWVLDEMHVLQPQEVCFPLFGHERHVLF